MESTALFFERLASTYRNMKGYQVDILVTMVQPKIPTISLQCNLAVKLPGSAALTVKRATLPVSGYYTNGDLGLHVIFDKKIATTSRVRNWQTGICDALCASDVLDIGLAELLSGFPPFGGDYNELRPLPDASVNGIPCRAVKVDVNVRSGVGVTVVLNVGKQDGLLYAFSTEHATIAGATRTATLNNYDKTVQPNAFVFPSTKGFQILPRDMLFGNAVIEGRLAPPLAGRTHLGKEFDLDSIAPRSVTLVHFWSSQSLPSCQQIGSIGRSLREFRAGQVTPISICLDSVKASSEISGLWKRLGGAWPCIIDKLGLDSDAARSWKVYDAGALAILNRHGLIHRVNPRSSDITQALRSSLQSK